jgi:hypothetical protein
VKSPGRSGSFLWVDPEAGIACACLTDRDFGPWAARAWPRLSDDVLEASGGEPRPRARTEAGRRCDRAGGRPGRPGRDLVQRAFHILLPQFGLECTRAIMVTVCLPGGRARCGFIVGGGIGCPVGGAAAAAVVVT